MVDDSTFLDYFCDKFDDIKRDPTSSSYTLSEVQKYLDLTGNYLNKQPNTSDEIKANKNWALRCLKDFNQGDNWILFK